MSDKDQFIFEDDDDFPETDLGEGVDTAEPDPGVEDDFAEDDLSAAFAEGEHVAENPVPDEPEINDDNGGSNRMRILLIVLLLIVAAAAGAYYFMGLGGSTPSVPTVQVPAQKVKSVELPVQPAKGPAKAQPAEKPVTVSVPLPPAAPAAPAPDVEAKAPVAAAAKPVEQAVVAPPKTAPAEPAVAKAAAPTPSSKGAPAPDVALEKAAPVEKEMVEAEAKPVVAASKPAAQAAPAAKPVVKTTEPVVAAVPVASTTTPSQVADGDFALDAGSYLYTTNRDSLVEKIRQLGYEPLITPVDAALSMTRLRLGTFSKDDVQTTLSSARAIEPGAYSVPAGDRYVVYAGTFLKSRNIDKLSQRFLKEGFKVYSEPVEVVRTLSRIRFGSFATKDDAASAAEAVARHGLQVSVVKSK